MIGRWALVLVLAAQACWGEDRVRWEALGPRVVNKKVELVLPDGTRVKGRATAVEPGGLRIAHGKRLIPRKDVSRLRVTEYRTRGRLLVTTGAVAASAGIALASYPDVSEGIGIVVVPAVIAGGVLGAAVAGYFIGKRLDKRVTEIQVVPGP